MTDAEIIAKALDDFEYCIERIEGEWGMSESIEKLRAKGDEGVLLLDSAREALKRLTS